MSFPAPRRSLLVAAVVAAAMLAVPWGASAQLVRVSGMAAPNVDKATPLTGFQHELLTNDGHDNIANALDLTVDVNSSICRFPSFCFLEDDNAGATMEGWEPNNCPEPSGPQFDSTLWYVFEVQHAGLLDVIIDNTLPDSPTPFLPVFEIFNGTTAQGFCGVASGATTNFGSTFAAGPGTTLGGLVYMAVGASFDGSVGGSFDLNLRWDPDTDGDGLLDSADDCDNQPGPEAHRGCPDSDSDGIRDIEDDCPNQGGPAGFRGCPDTDGDGIREPDDACPTTPGPGAFRGCPEPDSDGDGIRDAEDDCDNQRGPAGLGGCPDSDGDGIRDPDDRCAALNALRPASGITRSDERPRDGCPDTLLLHSRVGTRQDVGGTPAGILLRSFAVTGVPPGTRVLVVCRLPNGKRCGGVLVRRATTSSNVRAKAARRVSVKNLNNTRLPFGSKVIVRATAPYATGKFVSLTVVRTASRIKRVEGCMNRGSTRVRRRGCT